MGGTNALLYLKEERVVIVNAEKQDQICAGADRTDADNAGDVSNVVASQHGAAFGSNVGGVAVQGLG